MLIALIARLIRGKPVSNAERRIRADRALIPADELKLAGFRRTLGGSAALPFAR
ncbi:hypothetical protein [Phreatobacter aquaticus]|uniref:hypothetical protein n=1 Tax=Phreatobacter aquaticus TaxID=2570229 RepID=UPI00143DAADE|nr:hypothetical protein [Phreatobacter aquaticus]